MIPPVVQHMSYVPIGKDSVPEFVIKLSRSILLHSGIAIPLVKFQVRSFY